MSNSKVRGPVVNGLVLEVSDRGRSGFLGVSQRFVGAEALYFSTVSAQTIVSGGGTPSDFPSAQGGGYVLGYFKDPRVAAYLKAYYTSNPAELVRVFNTIVVATGGKTGKRQIEQDGVLAVNIPAVLYSIPNDYALLMKAFPAANRSGVRGRAPSVVGTMTAWSQLLKDSGTTGEAIYLALGGTPADQTFVLGLRTLDYEAAKNALASRGVVL